MSVNNMLSELAIESGLIEHPSVDESIVDSSIVDVLEDHHNSPQPTDVLAEVEQSGQVADQLETIADRADELTGIDEEYAAEALTAIGAELQTLTRIRKLDYAPTSFESAGMSGKAKAIASDARNTASHLRANAKAVSDLSNESRLLKLFKSKDSRIADSVKLINRDHGRIKQQTRVIEEKGVEVRHNFLGRFLTANQVAIPDLDKQLDVDLGYMKSWVKFVEDKLDELNTITKDSEIVPISEQSTTTFQGFSEGIISYAQFNESSNYPLLGSQGLGMGMLWDGAQGAKKLSVLSMTKSALGGVAMGGATLGAGLAIGAPMTGILGAGVVAFLVANKLNTNAMDKSTDVQVVSIAGLDSIVKKSLAIAELANTDNLYNRLNTVSDKERDIDKELAKHIDLLAHVIRVYLDIIKTHAFYITTNISMLLELTVKRLQSNK